MSIETNHRSIEMTPMVIVIRMLTSIGHILILIVYHGVLADRIIGFVFRTSLNRIICGSIYSTTKISVTMEV